MRRTRKHNKKYQKTRRGGSKNKLKVLPPLPPSPIITSVNNKKPDIKIKNSNLVPVEKDTYNWYKRNQQRKLLKMKMDEQPLWKRLLGIKREIPERVPLNSSGNPLKSYFNIDKNSGFKPNSKP
jgi:hypothetical protein